MIYIVKIVVERSVYCLLSSQFWSIVLRCGARLPRQTLNYWTASSVVPVFQLGVCLSVTLLIVDLWQYYVCCTRSGVTRYTLFMELFLYVPGRVTRGAVITHRTLMRLLAAEHRNMAGLLFPCQYLCGTILVTTCSMVWDWRVSRAGPILFIGLAARSIFVSCFPFLFFHSMGWYCGAGVLRRIGC